MSIPSVAVMFDELKAAGCAAALDLMTSRAWVDIAHGGTSLYDHCVGVGWLLLQLPSDVEIVLAGLLHPAYGAESFPGLVPIGSREPIEAACGAKVEQLVFLYSQVSEQSLGDVGLTQNGSFFQDRLGHDLDITGFERRALVKLFFANLAEQYLRVGISGAFRDQALRVRPVLFGLARMIGNSAKAYAATIYGEQTV